MNSTRERSPDLVVLDALRDATGPLTLDQLLEAVPESLRREKANLRQWVRGNVLNRPEVGRTARGVYVYLPDHITGSTYRVPVTEREAEDGYLRAGHALQYALRNRFPRKSWTLSPRSWG